MKLLLQIAALALLGSVLNGKNGSSYDTSGNSMLNGAFNFRHLVATSLDANGNPTEITAAYGVITFDGSGNYAIKGSYVDSTIAGGAAQALNVSSCASTPAPCGKYALGASGAGYLANPLSPGDASNVIRGAVAQGIFAGSDTESTRIACPGSPTKECTAFDLFVAIPAGTLSGNTSFATSYEVALLDFAGANSSAIKNAQGTLVPDGNGGIGTLLLSGQASNQAGSALSQFVNGATYSVNSDSSVTLTLPVPVGVDTASALFTGTRTLFVSGDGNFVLGWTPQGFDIIVGVKAPPPLAAPNGPQGFRATPKAVTPPSAQSSPAGLYFTSGIEDSPTAAGVDSFYGSISASGDSAGDAIAHQRVKSPFLSPYDYVTDDVILVTSSGSAGDYNGYQYSFSANGQAFVGTGSSGNYSVIVGAQAPKFTGPGVYLNPVGVVNAASYAPVTASLAPGELITLFGSGLSPVSKVTSGGQAFPANLAGVQVFINGIACPIYYVSPTQVSVIVPNELSTTGTFLADILVNNNSAFSNLVQVYWQSSAPGTFSQAQSGLGLAAARHAKDGSIVTAANPAVPGEFLEVFLTGLGTVTPAVADGAVPPGNKLSKADEWTGSNLAAYFNDYTSGTTAIAATIEYAGLVPGLAGLYQLNVQVPAGLAAGDVVYLEIQTENADMNQIQIPIGAAK